MTVSTSVSPSSLIGPLRSRRGCKTCKARKVKCGQEKPHCLRCSSTGRNCEYEAAAYGTFSAGTPVAIANPLSLSPDKSWKERRAFAYYSSHAAPLIGGLDVELWSTIVPRLCHTEPAVWDAIISISSLFESYKPATPTHKHQDALIWYSRSVSAVRTRIERGGVDAFFGLISCVLFIYIEVLQGGSDEALRLYCQGTQLAITLRGQIASGTVTAFKASLLEDAIVPIFSRLSIIANAQNKVQVGALLRDVDKAFIPGVSSLKAAREAIFVLTAETQQFQETCEQHHDTTNDLQVPPELISRQLALLARLENWQDAFESLRDSLGKTHSLQQTSTIALLITHHQMLHIIIATCISRFKITTDLFLSNFRTIVEQSRISLDASARSDGSQPPFSLDIVVGFPLWFTVLRCAEPSTRRIALALLRKSSHVQGFYSQEFGASFGESTMNVEELLASHLTGQDPVSTFSSSPTPEPFALSSASPLYTPNSGSARDFSSPMSPLPIPTELSMRIPEEARIKPYGAFRPLDGIPPGIAKSEIVKWNFPPSQTFLMFSRNRFDMDTGKWGIVHEIAPVVITSIPIHTID